MTVEPDEDLAGAAQAGLADFPEGEEQGLLEGTNAVKMKFGGDEL